MLSQPSSLTNYVLLMTCLVWVVGCAPTPRQNLLLVTFDTTRADHLGCYGNPAKPTPVLDALAASGTRFAQARSAVPITAPSHSTILTGRYPLSHGVRDNGLFVLGDDQLTLAEILAENGWATAAAIGAYPLIGRFGLGQGFELFDDHVSQRWENLLGERTLPKQRIFFDERPAAWVNEAVFPWLAENAGEPFFLWVHYFDPHQPFEPPPPYDQLFADDLYNGEIAYADATLGALLERLEELGVAERTTVVMTADHGEGRGEHNEITHAVLAYDSTLHVPLIVRAPGAPAGIEVEERVATVDIVPTVLDLLGVQAPEGLAGRSLAPFILGRQKSGEGENAGSSPRQHYAENLAPRLSHGWGELRVLYEGHWKYIHGPRPELYDLEADPGELENRVDSEPAEARRLRDALRGVLRQHAAENTAAPQPMDEEVRQRLLALGYLHANAGPTAEVREELRRGGIAPHERVGDVNELSLAKTLLRKERWSEAREVLAELLAGDPGSPLYLELDTTAAFGAGLYDEAWQRLESLRQQTSAGALPERLLIQAAAVRFLQGERQEAISLVAAHQAESPSAKLQYLLSTFHSERGEDEARLRTLRRTLEIDPSFVPAQVDLAIEHAKAGDLASAEKRLLRAIAGDPYFPKAQHNYGVLLAQDGRLAEASERFRRAIELWPSYTAAYGAAITVELARERRSAAEDLYARLVERAPRSPEAAAARKLLEAP